MNPRLKALELHGYKTFASRYNFEFPGNITAIVGPNGSGKSNISDSLRWVLGEQSYSLLRGRKTEDMIFSGSDLRPRAGMASATITFDNSDGWLPIDFSEVSIMRRAYRDGGNEYLLNGQRVRLKDISELLAQSGLAERTYTIIGQGLVDAALSLRPEERRRFFEEAAGIGLYRSRREEAITRLETTQRNLERVQDIISELGPRLSSLERQAKKAEEYDRVKADLDVLLKDWYGYHWHNTQKDLLHAREVLRGQEERLKTSRNKVEEVETRVQAARVRLQELRNELNLLHTQSAALHTEREKISRNLAVLDERHRSLISQEQQIRNDLSRAEENGALYSDRLEELNQEKFKLQKDLEEAQTQLQQAQENFNKRQAERGKIEGLIREMRRNLVNVETQQVQQKAHLKELTNRLETLLSSSKSISQGLENAESDLARVQSEYDSVCDEQQIVEKKARDLENKLQKENESLKRLEQEIREIDNQKSRNETELAKNKAQLEVVLQAERALTGLTNGARNLIQAAKQGKLSGNYKAISSLLDVPAQYEIAIASVLGEQLDAIWLDENTDPEKALEFLENAENGRAVLVPSKLIKKSVKLGPKDDPDCLGVAVDLINCDTDLREFLSILLGQVWVVKDRNSAKKLLKELPATGRIVTLKGEVFNGNGVIVAGRDARSNIVSRPRQKRELEEKIQELTRKIEALEDQAASVEEKIDELRASRQKIESEAKVARAEISNLNTRVQQSALAVEQVKQKQEWQKNQLSNLNKQVDQCTGEIAALEKTIEAGAAKAVEANAELRTMNSRLNELPLEELQSEVVHWNTSLAVSSRAVKEAERRFVEFQQTMNANRESLKQYQERIQQNQQAIQQLGQEKEQLTAQELELKTKIDELQKAIDPAENELVKLENENNHLQEEYSVVRQAEANAERFYSQAQLELTRTREALENLRRRIEEDFGLVALEYNEDVTGPTPLPLEGIDSLPQLTELPADLEEAINRERAQLKRMGAVNPDAQKEYYEVKERYEFLSGQMSDLKKADADLRQIISELDELMRKEFRKTFDAVAMEFKQMFTRLFGGGSAKLILTDDENPTETGIDIEARLPGRREQGLSLLSGGERSLTAVALIFSLLKVSPTPFCVMDEVDAALDEANVGRFTELLKELSQETQFILITHNRNTVQAANVIYGVTMGRDSASQVISLRLDEISDEMVR